ncbi:MAG: electron transport complex subunit RsxC, partial [Gallionella sp.]|nr:electron transport complex subunit RsxC [Gallionella sp.]
TPTVEIGQRVLKGQLIGMPEGNLSSAVHAPTSGTVTAIDMQQVAHPSGMDDLCITMIPDGLDEWIKREGMDYRTTSPADLRFALRMAGVVGLGGATFPSDQKLKPGKRKIQTLVINGAECEPYITCDDLLMRERALEIIRGAEIMRFMLDAETVLIGIEDNKPEAIAAMQAAAATSQDKMEVIAVPTLYPGGGAKQLIRVLTGIEVAAGVRSTDLGVQCFNVGTAYGVHLAITHGEPMISRIVTITGNVGKAQNFEVLFGTPAAELVAQANPLADTSGYLMGGPMMGFRLPSEQVGIIKASNCVIVMSDALFPPSPPAMPCIRCTRCAEVCPSELQPQELYWFAKSKNFEKARDYHLFDCIECGACSYVCPSHIPLVQYYRYAKGEIWEQDSNKKASDAARDRHEFRELRIEREKQEKAEKLAAKEKAALEAKEKAALEAKEKQALQPAVAPVKPNADPEDTIQMKIQTAIDHAKQQAAAIKPKNTEQLTPEQQAEIAEIEARRAHIRELARSSVEEHTKE